MLLLTKTHINSISDLSPRLPAEMTLEAAGPLEAGDWRSVVELEAAGGSCQFNQPNMDSGGMCSGGSGGGGVYTWESWDTPNLQSPPPSTLRTFATSTSFFISLR